MTRIKGKYVATVEIDFDFPQKPYLDLCPFEKIKKMVCDSLTPDMEEMLQNEIGKLGKIKVHQQLADLYEYNEGQEDL